MQKPRSFPERGLLFVMGIKLSIVLTLEQGCKTYSFALYWQKKKRERKPTKERAKKKSSLYEFTSES